MFLILDIELYQLFRYNVSHFCGTYYIQMIHIGLEVNTDPIKWLQNKCKKHRKIIIFIIMVKNCEEKTCAKKRLETMVMWLWSRMTRTSWTEGKGNYTVLQEIGDGRNIVTYLTESRTSTNITQHIYHQHPGGKSNWITAKRKTQTILLQRYSTPDELHLFTHIWRM